MIAAFNLEREARAFARQLSGLLNATVCNGVRLNAVVAHPAHVNVGYGISKTDLVAQRGIPLAIDAKRPRAYLAMSYRLAPDDAGRYLMVESSFTGLFAGQDLSDPLLHYDYERHKADGYPEAHLQVVAEPPAWRAMCQGDRPFAKAHLPVGGRRYRPTLEDVVEFAIVEGVADGRAGWRAAVEAGRESFRVRQLRAAIRRDPETARAILAEVGGA